MFAALDIATGTVFTECKQRHRHQEFLAFLRPLDDCIPSELDVHLRHSRTIWAREEQTSKLNRPSITHGTDPQSQAKYTPMERVRHPSRHNVPVVQGEGQNNHKGAQKDPSDVPATDP